MLDLCRKCCFAFTSVASTGLQYKPNFIFILKLLILVYGVWLYFHKKHRMKYFLNMWKFLSTVITGTCIFFHLLCMKENVHFLQSSLEPSLTTWGRSFVWEVSSHLSCHPAKTPVHLNLKQLWMPSDKSFIFHTAQREKAAQNYKVGKSHQSEDFSSFLCYQISFTFFIVCCTLCSKMDFVKL